MWIKVAQIATEETIKNFNVIGELSHREMQRLMADSVELETGEDADTLMGKVEDLIRNIIENRDPNYYLVAFNTENSIIEQNTIMTGNGRLLTLQARNVGDLLVFVNHRAEILNLIHASREVAEIFGKTDGIDFYITDGSNTIVAELNKEMGDDTFIEYRK